MGTQQFLSILLSTEPEKRRDLKSKVCAQTLNALTGTEVGSEEEEKGNIIGAGLGSSPKDFPQQHSQGGQHLGHGLLGHVIFSILELLCSVLTATLETKYPPPGKGHFW